MSFQKTEIEGMIIFQPSIFKDSRGYFFESYNEREFTNNGVSVNFIQDNQSLSYYGVIRGLHYQLNPNAQTKLVRVLYGKILDVAVDIRQGSPTYGKNFSIELSSDNNTQLLIPPGFAHGFSVLSEQAIVLYKCDVFYDKNSEAGIRFDDQDLNIEWGIPASKIIISEKDRQLPPFGNCKNNFVYSV